MVNIKCLQQILLEEVISPLPQRKLPCLPRCALGGESRRGGALFGARRQDRCPSRRFWW